MTKGEPAGNRLAAVLSASRQGSGYVITSDLVLTAAHVVIDPNDIRVVMPGQSGEITCEIVWLRHDDSCDAALISPRRGPFTRKFVQPVHLGSCRGSLEPIPNCQAIGFPKVQRDISGRLDTEQFVGTLKPGAKLLSARYVLDSSHNPPARPSDGTSPWAGLSGAAVFSRDVLIGVVAHDPAGWQHGRLEVTPASILEMDAGFRESLGESNIPFPFLTIGGSDWERFAEFEDRYRAYIVSKYGTLTIFGIDLSDRSNAEWPLDAAYLSLEAVGADEPTGEHVVDGLTAKTQGQVQAADQALAGHQRVLLRGVAGSGKTTLVQWLAVSAAKQNLGENLSHLQDRIPIVLPLRTLIRFGELPMPDKFLAAVRSPLAKVQPEGWVESILSAKRGLMLVDGIDEISERDRERVRYWLRDLMTAFPDNMWLVTSRPSAVSDSWLRNEGFTELSLSAMGRSEISAFITRWHTAAISTCQDGDEIRRLETYRSALITAIRTKQDLGRLATNPLMCGLICALHRDRRGYLPAGRKQLYDAALSMLLARRDQERDLDVQLPEEPQIQLLQKLAYWLIKNGQVEMDKADAIDLIAAALPSIPSISNLGTPSKIYGYLLLRSGLLREPTQGAVDFIHRTFQDYLGAKASVEERDFDLMVRNAHHDQWEDVIRMAVAHAYPAERVRILSKLIKRGDRVKKYRTRLHLLAMACLEHATELDIEMRHAVDERAAMLIPPNDHDSAEALASAGPMVLDLLPGPDSLSDEQAYAVVTTATLVRSDAALPVLVKFRDREDPGIQDTLIRAWRHFDVDQYGREIIAHISKDQLFWAYSIEQLSLLRDIGGRDKIIFNGCASAEQLKDVLAAEGPRVLGLHENEDIEYFSGLPNSRLETLYLYKCPKVRDLTSLSESNFLTELSVNAMHGLKGLQGLETLRSLTQLSIFQPAAQADLLMLPRGGKLKSLSLSDGAVESTGLRGLRECKSITSLTLRLRPKKGSSTIEWEELHSHQGVRYLRLDARLLVAALRSGISFPGIRHLDLDYLKLNGMVGEKLDRFPEVFPGVRKLSGYWTDEEVQHFQEIAPGVKVGSNRKSVRHGA